MKRWNWGWLMLCSAFASCTSTTTPDGGSQTHFVECKMTSECAMLGADFTCQEGRCERATGATNQAGRSGGTGASGAPADCSDPDDLESCPNPLHRAGAGGGAGTAGTTAGAGGSGTAGAAGSTVSNGGAGGGPVGDRICDGSDEMKLAVMSVGGFVAPSYLFTNHYGHGFLFVDGHCRYYAAANYMAGIATGTLTAAEAEQLARDVAYDRLATWTGRQDGTCPDASVNLVGREGAWINCSCGCDAAAPAGLADAMQAGFMWQEMLAENGTRLDGPVAAIAGEISPPTVAPPVAWPLTRTLASIPDLVQQVQSLEVTPVVFTGSEAEQLRELRLSWHASRDLGAVFADDGDGLYEVYIRDELPDSVRAAIDALLATR